MSTPLQISSATAFCKHVEARLGWLPEDRYAPAWQRYRGEASKVLRKIATNPELYTWRNLGLAVEYLAREKKTRSPVGVFSYVGVALEAAANPDPAVEEELRAALRLEMAKGDPKGWVERLNRAVGPFRMELLNQWRQEQ